MARLLDVNYAFVLDETGDYIYDEDGMAITALTVESELQRRLRIGFNEIALSDTDLYDIISKVQRTVNAALKLTLSSGTLTTSANTLIYTITSDIASDCYEVITLHDSTRTITKIPDWRDLKHYDRDWLTRTGSRFEVWSPLDRDKIILYPALTTNSSLSAIYVKEPTIINDSADTFDIPDDDIEFVYDLCEIILLAHLRRFEECENKIERFLRDLQVSLTGEI